MRVRYHKLSRGEGVHSLWDADEAQRIRANLQQHHHHQPSKHLIGTDESLKQLLEHIFSRNAANQQHPLQCFTTLHSEWSLLSGHLSKKKKKRKENVSPHLEITQVFFEPTHSMALNRNHR